MEAAVWPGDAGLGSCVRTQARGPAVKIQRLLGLLPSPPAVVGVDDRGNVGIRQQALGIF